MASELPPNASQSDIEQELIFTKVLIDSLDQEADGYSEQVKELESKVAVLEALLGLTPETSSQQSGFDQDLSGLEAFEDPIFGLTGGFDGAQDLLDVPGGESTQREWQDVQ
jgi:hypothetical protein